METSLPHEPNIKADGLTLYQWITAYQAKAITFDDLCDYLERSNTQKNGQDESLPPASSSRGEHNHRPTSD